MRKITILLLLISNICLAQSQQETIDWLNQKFKEHTDSFMGEYSIGITQEKGWGEALTIIKRVKNEYMPESFTSYTFQTKNISSVLTTSKFRSDGKLGIIISAKDKNIYMSTKQLTNEIEILCLPAPDETIISMQKGIIHLLNLMGNPIKLQKELFTN